MCDTPSVVRRIVASYLGGVTVVVGAIVVVVVVVVVVSADVGSGIDSGPSLGEHADTTETLISTPAVTSPLKCTTTHRARSGPARYSENGSVVGPSPSRPRPRAAEV